MAAKAKRKKKKRTSDVASPAEECARSDACVTRAERQLVVGDWRAARQTLSYEQSAAQPKHARWVNAASLACLLAGDVSVAFSMLDSVLSQPLEAVHLAAAKNYYWASHLHADALQPRANTNGIVAVGAAKVFEIFQHMRNEVEAFPLTVEGESQMTAWWAASGVSIFDLPVQRMICNHALYDRHRHDGQWDGLDAAARWRQRYLDLLQRSLTRYLTRDLHEDMRLATGDEASDVRAQCEAAGECEAPWHIGQGANDPEGPFSQKYLSGLLHLQILLDDVVARGIRGDVVEAGCYTGGTAVLLRALLEDEDDGAWEAVSAREGAGSREERARRAPRHPPRRLLLADSFEGIPLPRTERGRAIDTSAEWPVRYSAGIKVARSTLRRYGFALDERLVFVPGFFNESLPTAPTERVALIHIDADAYDSVLDALRALYSRLAPGGHVVVDDFHLPGVRAAVLEFRRAHAISAPLLPAPADHITTCTPDWSVAGALSVHPTTVAYWTRESEERSGSDLRHRIRSKPPLPRQWTP